MHRISIALAVLAAGCKVVVGGDSGLPFSPGDPQALARGPKGAWNVAVDDLFIYWVAVPGDSHLLRAPRSGGAVEELASSPYRMAGIALDAEHVYTTVPGEIFRVRKDGTQRQSLVTAVGYPGLYPSGVVIDDRFAYWMTNVSDGNGNLGQAPVDGSGPPTELAGHLSNGNPPQLLVDEEALYFSDANGIERMPKAGGARQIVSPRFGISMAMDTTTIYFTSCIGGTCSQMSLFAVDKSGSGERTVATHAASEGGIALGPDIVTWAGRAKDGFVVALPKAGGATTDLASGGHGALAIAVDSDGSHAFWVDFEDGTVYGVALR